MTRAYGASGALPYLEVILDNAADNLTLSGTDQNVVWSRVSFDKILGAVTFDGVDEMTVVTAGDYRIEADMVLNTTGSSRFVMSMEIDPLGVGSYAFVKGTPLYFQSLDAGVGQASSLTVTLAATDKIRWVIRRLIGSGPDNTDGGNGGTWRITKLT